ncbi:MAG: hypothetical protein Q8Q23_00510 [bacterium]|nr:hypothetical protein [bacterium]
MEKQKWAKIFNETFFLIIAALMILGFFLTSSILLWTSSVIFLVVATACGMVEDIILQRPSIINFFKKRK